MQALQDQSVLITGGGGGLGVEVTREFLRRGALVTVPVAGPPDADHLRDQLGDDVQRLTEIQADLRDEPEVARVIDSMPQLHAVVHLVGGFSMAALHAAELTDYRRLVELNVTTTFLVLKHALRRMRDSGYGRIVTVASQTADRPTAQMGVYGATKAAVLHMTRTAAEETKDFDVTANCVLPSIIDTPANREAMGDAEANRWVAPASLAQTIATLASPEAKDLRGTAVRIYGRV